MSEEDFEDNEFDLQIPFFVHDIAGVDHSVTLQKVTSISQDEVQALLLDFPVCEDVDWGFTDTDKTQSISKTPYELNALEKSENVKFNFSHYSESHYQSFVKLFPEVNGNCGVSFCEALYAHFHDDIEVIDSKGQLMIILENESQHVIYSIDDNGITHSLCPKAGDILFLDISCLHALVPQFKTDNPSFLKMSLMAVNKF